MSASNHRVSYHKTRIASVDAATGVSARDFPRHTHDQFGIGIIDRGEHRSLSDAGEVSAGPGNLILVNPGEVHDGRAVDSRERAWRMLYFEPALIHDLEADLKQERERSFALSAPVVEDARVGRLFDTAFGHAVGGGNDVTDMAFDVAALEIVAHMLRALGGRRKVTSDCNADPVRRARDLIDAHPSRSFSLAALASAVGLSRFQLHRGFLRDAGLPPHVYIVQRRVALARRLLKAGHKPVEAALAAGFCDQSHLNRVFVQTFGASPGRYR